MKIDSIVQDLKNQNNDSDAEEGEPREASATYVNSQEQCLNLNRE